METRELQDSWIDYLEAIFSVGKDGGVCPGEAANALGTGLIDAEEALSALNSLGYVFCDESGLVYLTERGHELAEAAAERRTTLSRWLVGMGVDVDAALDDAGKISRVVSPDSFRMFKEQVELQIKRPNIHRETVYSGLFLKNCPGIVFLFDESQRFLACSQDSLPLLSNTDNDGRDNVWSHIMDIFKPELGAGWANAISALNSQAMERMTRRKAPDLIYMRDGQETHVQVVVSPITDEDGMCMGTIMIMDDITELVETKRRAEMAAESKSSFLANMSHEIRTPMNAVKGLSELLALTELTSLQRNYVSNIINSANSLLGIINDVLDFSKIDARKIEFLEGPYDLAGMITGVCGIVSIKADDKNLLLLIDADPSLPSTVQGDDVRIKQILTNLISNAVKYTNSGYVKLAVRPEERSDGLWIIWEVSDSGVGIKQEDMDSIFDAFSRADLMANRNIAGTGLGLAITKQLAAAMGGEINVKSEYGKGSVFTFAIKQKAVDAAPIAAPPQEAVHAALLGFRPGEQRENMAGIMEALGAGYVCMDEETVGQAELSAYTHCIYNDGFPERLVRLVVEQSPGCVTAAVKNIRNAMTVSDKHDTVIYQPVFIGDIARFLGKAAKEEKTGDGAQAIGEIMLEGATVLVVDDNEINLIVGSEMLKAFGAEAVCAESGDEAISLCGRQKFDIIYMDHMMPGKDGIETTKILRNIEGPNKHTPIVALTANVVNNMAAVYLKNGMDDFIGKPVEMSDVGRTLRRWLPDEKIKVRGFIAATTDGGPRSRLSTPQDIITALDEFGMFSSDVMRELDGDFDAYIVRMEEAGKVLDGLVARLKADVIEKRWESFEAGAVELSVILHGVGARLCAGRARQLAAAAREGNLGYIYEDFLSLMGNMFMLSKKLEVIVPFARGGDRRELPLGSDQYLHGCLERLGRAVAAKDGAAAAESLEKAAAFSLDMELDMALKAIKNDLENGDYEAALKNHSLIFRLYSEKLEKGA